MAAEGLVVDTKMLDEPTPTRGMAPQMAPDHSEYAAIVQAVEDAEGSKSDGSGMILEYMGDKVFMPL